MLDDKTKNDVTIEIIQSARAVRNRIQRNLLNGSEGATDVTNGELQYRGLQVKESNAIAAHNSAIKGILIHEFREQRFTAEQTRTTRSIEHEPSPRQPPRKLPPTAASQKNRRK